MRHHLMNVNVEYDTLLKRKFMKCIFYFNVDFDSLIRLPKLQQNFVQKLKA